MLAGALRLAAQDHAGQPVPKYVTGDECLFCHRVKVADTGSKTLTRARSIRATRTSSR